MVNKIIIFLRRVKSRLNRFLPKRPRIIIESSWSTDTALGIKGWVANHNKLTKDVNVSVGGVSVPITSWLDNENDIENRRDFWVQIPRTAQHKATFKVAQGNKNYTRHVTFNGSAPQPPVGFSDADGIFDEFVKMVNEQHLNVLEIGSRILPPKTHGLKNLFPQAASYTGFDYYPDSNTDVVGDAHALSSYFEGKKFDAVFSIAVMEHLAMPWVVAMEINKILKTGGITCHLIPFAWPAHELPWDFWRCSDEGLKVLFSKPIGYETIKAGMCNPIHMYFDKLNGREAFPTVPCFGCSTILTKKVHDVNEQDFKWPVELIQLVGDNSHYPPLADSKE